MSKFGNNNKNHLNYLVWLFIYMGIGLVIASILPFPVSLVVLLLVLFLVNIVRTELALRKAGIGGIKGLYKSYSSLGLRRGLRNGLVYTSLKCMNCGNEHRRIVCPKCGSKAVRAG